MKLYYTGKAPIILSHLQSRFDVAETKSFELNCVYIFDFNSNQKEVFNKVKECYNAGIKKFILDCSFEGPALQKEDASPTSLKYMFSEFFDSCPLASVLFITQNIASINYFNYTFGKHNGSKAVLYNHIIYGYANRMRFLNDKTAKENFLSRLTLSKPRSGKVLCLNNIAKPHRLALGSILWREMDFASDKFSFLGRNLDAKTLENAIKLCPKHKNEILDFYDVVQKSPIILQNEDATFNPRQEGAFPVDLFRNTSISIVTESEFTNGTIKRVTEKVLKSLACGHELLVFGNPDTLAYLTEMGFDVTSEIFDNLYDTVKRPVERFDYLLGNVKELLAIERNVIDESRVRNMDRILQNISNFNLQFKAYAENMKFDLEQNIEYVFTQND